jgi:hypothetical protein
METLELQRHPPLETPHRLRVPKAWCGIAFSRHLFG